MLPQLNRYYLLEMLMTTLKLKDKVGIIIIMWERVVMPADTS